MTPEISIAMGPTGWACRNGHWNDRAMTTTACLTCGAIRDPRALYEGLTPDIPSETSAGRGVWLSDTAKDKSMRWRFTKKTGGFPCFRCAELFANKTTALSELEAKQLGRQQPGSNFEFFPTREDLRWHIKNVHRGKPYADKEIRRLAKATRGNFKGELSRELGKN